MRVTVSLAVAAVLSAAAWHISGKMFASEAAQVVANRWAELERCLLGDGLPSGVLPSARLRAIELAAAGSESQWPEQCAPFAAELDAALAAPAIRPEAGSTRPLQTLLAAGAVRQGAELDAIWRRLRAADLPPSKSRRAVPLPPEPAKPRLQSAQLAALGNTTRLQDLLVDFDASNGRTLRLMFGGKSPSVCHFNDGPRKQRWQSAVCRKVPLELQGSEGVRLARAEPGAADLIYLRKGPDDDGFYDAASGLRLWRPQHRGAQALVHKNGVTAILYARREREQDGRIDHWRLVRFKPGKRPRNRRLAVPKDATARLMPRSLVWWSPSKKPDRVEIFARTLLDQAQRLGPAKRIGTLPASSDFIGECASDQLAALLFVTVGLDEPKYHIVFRQAGRFAPPVAAGVLRGNLALSCDEEGVLLSRRDNGRLSSWRCTTKGCVAASSGKLPLFSKGLSVATFIGKRALLVYSTPNGPVRLRIGTPDELEKSDDVLLFDDARHGGMTPTALRLVGGNGLALLLLQTQEGAVYAVRIDSKGRALPVRAVR